MLVRMWGLRGWHGWQRPERYTGKHATAVSWQRCLRPSALLAQGRAVSCAFAAWSSRVNRAVGGKELEREISPPSLEISEISS